MQVHTSVFTHTYMFTCSLHASTDIEAEELDEEETQEREELLEEMRRHSRLATATQPINAAYPKSPVPTDSIKDDGQQTEPGHEQWVASIVYIVVFLSYNE